jgi:hypothetical protein
VLDISINGKVLAAVISHRMLPVLEHTHGQNEAFQDIKLGFSSSAPTIRCKNFVGTFIFEHVHIITTSIEFFSFKGQLQTGKNY